MRQTSSAASIVVKETFPLWGILFLILFSMKVMAIGMVANWSWWLVTAPLWAPTVLAFSVSGFFALMMGAIALVGLTIAWFVNRR